jgi:hypothetical protein
MAPREKASSHALPGLFSFLKLTHNWEWSASTPSKLLDWFLLYCVSESALSLSCVANLEVACISALQPNPTDYLELSEIQLEFHFLICSTLKIHSFNLYP